MRGAAGFSKAEAAEKQYLQSGLRPEIPEEFQQSAVPFLRVENPQIFNAHF